MINATNAYESLGLAQPVSAPAAKQNLGQADFLKLMTTQLQSQDPFKPMDSAQFLGQIAQFSTVSGIESLNTGFATLSENLTANQALQGASLVGRSVQVPGDALVLGAAGNITASAALPVSGSVSATIRDPSGAVVRHLDLGTQSAGSLDVTWDGVTDSGERAAAGIYSIRAELTAATGATEGLATEIVAPVTAVRLGARGLQLELAGEGTVALSSVTQIR